MHLSRPTPRAVTLLLFALLAAAGRTPLAQNADEAGLRLEAAIRKQMAADYKGAIAAYQAILEAFPNRRDIAPNALWRLGQAQEQVGRTDLARQAYQRLTSQYAGHSNAAAASKRLVALAPEPTWSADGESAVQIILDDSSRRDLEEQPARTAGGRLSLVPGLTVHDRQTNEYRLVTSGRAAASGLWNPTRSEFAYVSENIEDRAARRKAGVAVPRPSLELRVVNVDNMWDRVMFQGTSIEWLRPMAWSPDGTSIAVRIDRTNGNRDLAVVDRAGTPHVLKRSPMLATQDLSFSADGQFIVYRVPTAPALRQFEFVLLPVDNRGGLVPERRYALLQARQRAGAPREEELIVHVLNRTGFGPRPGDIERVKATGIEAYITQQLYPEKIADHEVDAQIARFPALRLDIPELLEKAIPVSVVERRRATIFERPEVIARQRARVAANPDPVASAGGATRVIVAPNAPVGFEIAAARLYRAVHSERQLQEVMVDFWMNHFSVNHDDHQLTSHYEEAIRSRALGRFEDLLRAVAKHPRMLFYLDNWRSSAPAAVINARLAELQKTADFDGRVALLERRPFLQETKGLNENFARELLELHTVGVDGGYTQDDVVAVAKILSGWTIRAKGLANARDEDGVFWFDPVMHVDGDKVVMGQTIKSGGVDEGDQLLAMLARHPSTARYIATKLARRFVADEPPAAVVDNAARAFVRTGGDIREVLRAILLSPQFQSSASLGAKIKKPIELVASALRAVDASFESMDTYLELIGERGVITRMGERVYTHEAPDGNPDVGPAWMNSNALLVRLDFANNLATGRLPGVTANLQAAQLVLGQLGVPKPTTAQIEHTKAMLQQALPAAPPAGSGPPMMVAAPGATTGAAATTDPAALAVAAMLGSPQFQKR